VRERAAVCDRRPTAHRDQDVQHDALALLDLDWISRAEHLAVDRCHIVDRVHITVVAAQELPVPVMEAKADLSIISSRVVTRFDQQETVQPAVLRLGEILPRERVRVIPTETCWLGGHGIARRGTRRNHRRAFFHCSVDIRRQVKAVPVNNLRIFRQVPNLNRLRFALTHPEQRTGNLAVVSHGPDVMLRRSFQGVRRNLKCHVRRRRSAGRAPDNASEPTAIPES
jgi:hypothetical protein